MDNIILNYFLKKKLTCFKKMENIVISSYGRRAGDEEVRKSQV